MSAVVAIFTQTMLQLLQKFHQSRAWWICAIIAALLITANGLAAQTLKKPGSLQPAQLRLLSAGQDADTGKYRAVIEIALDPGYKTYWRDPGDSGVPTEFNWDKSEHIANVQTQFPAPVRFFDGTGQAIGYLQTVRFPVEITPSSDGQKPVLRLLASFGVCRELCIPEEAEAEMVLSEVEAVAGLWKETLAQVPFKAKLGENMEGLELRQARLNASGLSVVLGGEDSKQSDVFIEASEGWQFGQPQHSSHGGSEHFVFPIVASRAGSKAVEIRLTIKGEKSAIELPLSLSTEQP